MLLFVLALALVTVTRGKFVYRILSHRIIVLLHRLLKSTHHVRRVCRHYWLGVVFAAAVAVVEDEADWAMQQ
jgi:hypothetical protein